MAALRLNAKVYALAALLNSVWQKSHDPMWGQTTEAKLTAADVVVDVVRIVMIGIDEVVVEVVTIVTSGIEDVVVDVEMTTGIVVDVVVEL